MIYLRIINQIKIFINKYIENLKPEHPATTVFGVARIAPEKTRGSLFTSATSAVTNGVVVGELCISDIPNVSGRKYYAVEY